MLKNKDIRAAKEFLRKRGVKGISPKKFAEAAEEGGLTYAELVKSLSNKAKEIVNA